MSNKPPHRAIGLDTPTFGWASTVGVGVDRFFNLSNFAPQQVRAVAAG